MSGKAHNLTGKRYGRLIVISRAANRQGKVMWLCKCDCGNTKEIAAPSLVSGRTQSCGCLSKERTRIACTKHGGLNTRLYRIWRNMKSRCACSSAAKHFNYGGKGITVCEEWNEFSAFREWALSNGYTDNLTIDRKDSSKGYTPENCRWATTKEQNNNTSQNHILDYNNFSGTIAQWAERIGLPYKVLSERIRREWTIERALNTPIVKKIRRASNGRFIAS